MRPTKKASNAEQQALQRDPLRSVKQMMAGEAEKKTKVEVLLVSEVSRISTPLKRIGRR